MHDENAENPQWLPSSVASSPLVMLMLLTMTMMLFIKINLCMLLNRLKMMLRMLSSVMSTLIMIVMVHGSDAYVDALKKHTTPISEFKKE